jgi:hypothetical protein
VQVFPLAEGVLANEVQAAPLSKKARTALLEEEETAFLELPPPTARTKQLPPSARKKTSQQKKAKHKRERRREQRLKEKKTGGPGGIGHLTSFSGHGQRNTLVGHGSTSSSTPVQVQPPFPRNWWAR